MRSRQAGALDRVEFEMLEGMAPAQARTVLTEAHGLLMYAPVAADEDFDASIAYLSPHVEREGRLLTSDPLLPPCQLRRLTFRNTDYSSSYEPAYGENEMAVA